MGKPNEQALRWLREIEVCLSGWEAGRSQVAPEGLPFDYNDFCIANSAPGARFSVEMAAEHIFRKPFTAVCEGLNVLQREELDAGIMAWMRDINGRLDAWDQFCAAALAELHPIWDRCPPRVPVGQKRALRKRISSMFNVWDGPAEADWIVWSRKERRASPPS